MDSLRNQAVALEDVEVFRQHFGTDARQAPLQAGKEHRTVCQGQQNRRPPFPLDDVDEAIEGAIIGFATKRIHRAPSLLVIFIPGVDDDRFFSSSADCSGLK